MMVHQSYPYSEDWPEPASRFLRLEVPPAPELRLHEVLAPGLAKWVEQAAEAKGAPADYVFAGLLAVSGAAVGNARWASPWKQWKEPPTLWAALIGLPSAGKSPALDAVLEPYRKAERAMRAAADAKAIEWQEKAELGKLLESAWKDMVKKSVKAGEEPPERPKDCDVGPSPHTPRLIVNDGTIERLADILARQPRGTLQMRDELAGWLENMQRYSSGGSDRAFWLEAFGGRSFSVERMNRPPLTVDRLTIGVLGGIQPDRLNNLLFKADDDGLLARFIPFWPEPAPLRRPRAWADDAFIDCVLERLLALDMRTDENGETRPLVVSFTDDAQALLNDFRQQVRDWEEGASGLMLSFIGKLPGLAVRLSLVLRCLDFAAGECEEPSQLTVSDFGRAAHLVEAYFLPMAKRTYAEAATPKVDRAARRVISIIREKGWKTFTSRQVMRLDRPGLGNRADLDPALAALEDGECIRLIDTPSPPQGGRRPRLYAVNPALHGGCS